MREKIGWAIIYNKGVFMRTSNKANEYSDYDFYDELERIRELRDRQARSWHARDRNILRGNLKRMVENNPSFKNNMAVIRIVPV